MVSNIKLYKNGEELVDSARGDCPKCEKGYLSIDQEESFIAVIGNNQFSFDVVVCDRCDHLHLEKWISQTDKIKISSD
jgi:endogenous inhibitor of DNA gyrase (YacG/DUF329 family)